ncbi:hypothetical protein [Mycobacterium aquaticum]|uniref:Uncharacterized protein n=1 Tax=Mycobacterium aquaticum TaxID=1927124 RepID=A0A1X0A4W5_9MYCO|nr:hypothetical protein [Mycobacterium aquaticum]ORA24908.1 hypothetical protein BST13_33605 [Mycobacterium aquaticum]
MSAKARELAAHVLVIDKRTEGYAQALKDVENSPEILLLDRDEIVCGYPFMDGYHEALAALDKALNQ